jgi:transposase
MPKHRTGSSIRPLAAFLGSGPADHDRLHPSESASDGGEPPKKGVLSRCIGRTKGGLNSKLHVICDEAGKPLVMLLTEGQMSDHKGARLMLEALPEAKAMTADRGYDSDRFRMALAARGTTPCIPPTKSRKTPLDYDKTLYRQRHKIENFFAKLKDWRRIATREKMAFSQIRAAELPVAGHALVTAEVIRRANPNHGPG